MNSFSVTSVFFVLMLFTGSSAAQPAAYPSKPIRFVVPYPAGGPLDTVARLLGQKVGESTRQPVVVDNKPGAGGNIGADSVAKSQPDGYTILMGAVATHAINPTLYASIPYDAARDFIPVTQVASTPNVLVVNPAVPARDLREFIAYAKANPGKLNFGSGSTGSAGHLAGELFKAMAGVEMTHVPYKGAAPAMNDLIGGQIQLMFDNLASSLAQVRAGKVRALAVTTAKRSSLAPELPTIAESGLPGFEATSWFALLGAPGIPRDVQMRINAETLRVLAMPDVKDRLAKLGLDPRPGTPEALAGLIQSETGKWAKVVKASGARIE
jgi:tripartite-type tricarboxylate transporter receptor subunit TctC